MIESKTSMLVHASLLCLFLTVTLGCDSKGNSKADGGPDSGTDTDTDTDTGTGGDYWEDGTCNGDPDQGADPSSTDCNGLTFEGCCDEQGNVVWCVNELLGCFNCDADGEGPCGWDLANSFYNCDGSGVDPSGENPFNCPGDQCPDFECPDSCIRYVRADADESGDGLSWETAFYNVGQPLANVNMTLKCCEVTCQAWVAEGTYYIGSSWEENSLVLIPGLEIYGGFAGVETSLDERDWVAHPTVLDGRDGPDGEIHVLHVVRAVSYSGDSNAVLDGFRITAGVATSGNDALYPFGGGALVEGGSPALANLTIVGNDADYGGGVAVLGGSPVFTNCVFENNTATHGGAVFTDENATSAFDRCVFSGNAAEFGGGLAAINSSPSVTNSSFHGNEASELGGAMVSAFDLSQPVVVNSVFWGDTPDEIADFEGSITAVTYSDIQGGWPGVGNIDVDPLFTDASSDDYTLQGGSPCIDAANGDLCSATCVDDLTTDDTGVGDPTYCDVGAFEFLP